MNSIHEFARQKMTIECNRMKKTYDYKISCKDYKDGDLVWLYNPRRSKGRCPKLQRPWEGPYTVIQKLNDVVYRVTKNARATPKVVHHDRLKPYMRNPTCLH